MTKPIAIDIFDRINETRNNEITAVVYANSGKDYDEPTIAVKKNKKNGMKNVTYTRFIKALQHIINNPEKFSSKQKTKALDDLKFIMNFYAENHCVVTKRNPDGLFVMDRYNKLSTMVFKLAMAMSIDEYNNHRN